jgi:bifunctional DNA-binding transcriptional regulator/antitoxin component of YhaV-PrlF toxin-antitoxin module
MTSEQVTFRAIISSKGRVVIPVALRRRCCLKPKTRLVVSEQGGGITLTPIQVLIDEMRGSLKGTGTMREFLEERARERKLEAAKYKRLYGKARKRAWFWRFYGDYCNN